MSGDFEKHSKQTDMWFNVFGALLFACVVLSLIAASKLLGGQL